MTDSTKQLTLLEKIIRLFTPVKPGEGKAALLLLIQAFILLFAYYLLKPAREGNRRIYSPADRTRLRLILRGKRLGFSLDESAEIVLMYGSAGNNRKQLEKLISGIREKQVDLRRQQEDLAVMLADLQDAEKKCLVALNGLDLKSAAKAGDN